MRPTTHRGNGSDSQPIAGLSDGRLALVHRYMIDAEEAEVLARAEEMERRRAEPLIAGAATTKPEAVEEPIRAMAPVTKVAPGAVEEVARGDRPDPRDEARARKALMKADKSAAKQAARRMAALEKKEARERKALAKAAARRKTA